MTKISRKVSDYSKKGISILKSKGALTLAKRSGQFIYYKNFPNQKKKHVKDILFINGCTLPHPTRYRVDNQLEELVSNGMTADTVFYEELTLDILQNYRGFIFFRCPVTDTVRKFIEQAKFFNKSCFFDVDDLVIDTKYTNQIDFVKNMNKQDKLHYDDGVNRMNETLRLCDYAITSTTCLGDELSNYVNDVFVNRNVASDEMLYRSIKATNTVTRDSSIVVIGYFSGSITHNEDFDLVLPSLLRLLEKHENLYIKVVGILDIPPKLQKYKSRIINVSFKDWRLLPLEIAACDINIAPIKNTIFNKAKSENKWLEASLVKVVTVASNVGAFKDAIDHAKTGFLSGDTEWYEMLDTLIVDPKARQKVAEEAFRKAKKEYTTVASGNELVKYVASRLRRNIAFVLPSTDISGGINVVLKHADILRENGWDVTLIDTIDKPSLKKARKNYDYRLSIPGYNVILKNATKLEGHFDTMVATLWSTLDVIKKYPNVKNAVYFVQNYETDFYPYGAGIPRFMANTTYADNTNVRYVTMSLWCQKWLKEQFDKESLYCSNGIDLEMYEFKKRDFSKSKITILVEGDSSSEYKNTDEAFRIIKKLDPNKFSVSYLSYRKEPKDWYRVDNFYNRISPDKVGEVYGKCDILLKTSLLESFSYPPLEMMATGGLSVVVPNDGNVEYLRDGENCLFYNQGELDDAIEKINLIVTDMSIREKLIRNGISTAKKYEWKNIEKDVTNLYE